MSTEELKDLLVRSVTQNEKLQEIRSQVQVAVDEAVREARSGVALMQAETQSKVQETQSLLRDLTHQYLTYESAGIQQARESLSVAIYQYPSVTLFSALSASLLLLPASRKFILRRALGGFYSDASLVERAERQLSGLRQSLNVSKNDVLKLKERTSRAEVEFLTGQQKLLATERELKRLHSHLSSTHAKTAGLKSLLLDLPIRDSLRLRAEMAAVSASAKAQKDSLYAKLDRIARVGVHR